MIEDEGNTVECLRQAIQLHLDAAKSAAERNRLGQYATPNALAIDIARYVDSVVGQSIGDIRFADPSVGSGSFYSAAVTVFGRDRMRDAIGVELDVGFAEAARTLWSGAGLNVVQGDFTRIVADSSRPPSPNVILANPPMYDTITWSEVTRNDCST